MSLAEFFKRRKRRFVKIAGGAALRKLEQIVRRASVFGNPAFYKTEDFPWVKELEANWEVIREEAEYIVSLRDKIPNFQDISKDQRSLTKDDKWKTFFLYGLGVKSDLNCSFCPETARLIEKVPGMKTAFFSILLPHKEIPQHRGLFNAVLRYHLGLIIPQPKEKCAIMVDGETRSWEPGKSMIFDDTYQHSAWNRTDEVRVILFMDVMRPMRRPWNVFFDLIIKGITKTGYVKDAQRNGQEWEEKLRNVPKRKIRERVAEPVA